MPRATWNNFSQTDADPGTVKNPVVRCRNMVMRDDGVAYKRRAFDGSLSDTPTSHGIVEADGDAYLLIKTTSTVKHTTGDGSFTDVVAGNDWDFANSSFPSSPTAVDPDTRGSFATHGSEIYYSDPATIFAWSPTTGARRPGVPAMTRADGGELLYGQDFGSVPSFGALLDGWYDTGGAVIVDPTNPQYTPYIVPGQGEKTLNTGFAFSWYDPIRDIYGKRNPVYALPYIFGPVDEDGSNSFLTDYRTQYAKVVSLPPVSILGDGHANLQIAIWFSLGQNIVANPNAIAINFQGWVTTWFVNEWFPAMSKRMTSNLYLEERVSPTTSHSCRKDNVTLYQSGRYVDVYERPVPSRLMAILQTGTAVYFYPWVNEDTPMVRQQLAEYSVKHPEQVGRGTETQRETTTTLPNLRGEPEAVSSDGNSQILFTRQGIYSISPLSSGFTLTELAAGIGLRGKNIAESRVGLLWMADEGVAWLRGGQSILMDRRIGYGRWFETLTAAQRSEVVVGAADSLSQILVWLRDPDTGSGQRILCFDHERKFISEFTGSGACTYAVYFRGRTSTGLYAFGEGIYPGTGYASEASEIIVWLNEAPDKTKKIKGLSLDMAEPAAFSSIGVDVAAYRHCYREPADPSGLNEGGEDEHALSPTEVTTSFNLSGAGHYKVHGQFEAMEGRCFRIRIYGSASTHWGIKALHVDYDVDGMGQGISDDAL